MTNKRPHAGKVGHERDFLKLATELAGGGRRQTEVFYDFLEMAFCAVAKTAAPSIEKAEALEARYMAIASKRERPYLDGCAELLGLTALAIGGGDGGDFLGRVSGELGALNGAAGQFFTPFEVSKMMARMTFAGAGEIIAQRGFLTMEEPACGAGGMVLAAAEVLTDMGFDPRRQLFTVARDISGTAIKMAYLQCAFAGLPVVVIHGDTLRLTEQARYLTRPVYPFLSEHGDPFKEQRPAPAPAEPPPEAIAPRPVLRPVQPVPPAQMELF